MKYSKRVTSKMKLAASRYLNKKTEKYSKRVTSKRKMAATRYLNKNTDEVQ